MTTLVAPLRGAATDPREWGHDDYTAVFFNWHVSSPVFHGFGETGTGSRDVDRSADFTRCGLLVSEYVYSTGQLREPGHWLPMRHAVKFGRPCPKCFPRGAVAQPDPVNQEQR